MMEAVRPPGIEASCPAFPFGRVGQLCVGRPDTCAGQVVLGAGGVGKTALIMRYSRDVFEDIYNPTIEDMWRKKDSIDGAFSRAGLCGTAPC